MPATAVFIAPLPSYRGHRINAKPEQNLYVTQKLLGHRDIKVTLSYIEHNVEMLRSCVREIDKTGSE